MTEQEPAAPAAPAAPRRVVVAEDESLIRLDIVEILRDNGYDVVGEAGDGEDFVDMLKDADAIVPEEAAETAILREEVRSALDELTERERNVMGLVARGLPNKLIADELAISVRTVEVHRARVFDKMNVRSAVELANVLRDTRG